MSVCRGYGTMSEKNTDLLKHLTWEEAGEAIESADFIVLPTGSTEQHSTHLPLFVDTIRAETLSEILAKEAPRHGLKLLVAPGMPFGYSEHHMNFPGTITLQPETYKNVLIEIGQSLKKHGAKRMLTINCHGGNRESIKLAADRLQRYHDLDTHTVSWTDYARRQLHEHFGDEFKHAGDHETSVMEYWHPELVVKEKKEHQPMKRDLKTQPYKYFEDISEKGAIGDPTNSDPAFMEQVIADTTERILESLKHDIEQ